MTWKPIETAPRDGTRILTNSGVGVRDVRWMEDRGDLGPGWCAGYGAARATAVGCSDTMTHWCAIPEFIVPNDDQVSVSIKHCLDAGFTITGPETPLRQGIGRIKS